MPELPEVETVRRGLQPAMEGAVINRLTLNRPDLRFPFPSRLADRLAGLRITAMARRAKYLLIHVSDGSVLISHLGMSGSYRIGWDDSEDMPGEFHYERSSDKKHDHIVFELGHEDGRRLKVIYNDPRRFGFLLLTSEEDMNLHPMLANLGIEPTGNQLDGAFIAKIFLGKKTSLKAALLDQRNIAGLGNIYVSEALWRAGLSPLNQAGSIVDSSGVANELTTKLADSIRSVIADAIAAGGSSLRDHRQTDGSLGYFQHSFSVYNREGIACPTPGCSGVVERIVQNGRSTFFCGSCQT